MRHLRLTALAAAVGIAVFVAGVTGSARAGWVDINVLKYDSGGQKCVDGVDFGLAWFGPRMIDVEVRLTDAQFVTDGAVIYPRTTLSIPFNPEVESNDRFRGSMNFRLIFNPQLAVNQPIKIFFYNTGGSLITDVGAIAQACMLPPEFELFGNVKNPPQINEAEPGKRIKVKFKLPNAGPSVLDPGWPRVAQIPCSMQAPNVEPNTMPASGTLSYHGNHYTYEWQTDASWTGCRQLQFNLTRDDLVHRANFNFG